jgi:hypothetical protein
MSLEPYGELETEEAPVVSMFDPIVSPENYRAGRPGIEGFRLVSARVTVTLLDDPRRARYEYVCHLETSGGIPARYWTYHVPADPGEIHDLRAWDARGKLQPRIYTGEGRGARLEVRLRAAVAAGERYTFGFGYETEIRPVVAVDGRMRVVTYADWVIFNVACGILHVQVELPRGSEPLMAVPATGEDEGGHITYRYRRLRTLETAMFTVVYRASNRRRPAYMRAAAAVAAAAMGT